MDPNVSISVQVGMSVLVFLVATFIWPILKSTLIQKSKPFSPSPSGIHLMVSLGIAATMTAMSVWSVILAALGPAVLGTWSTPLWAHKLGWILYAISLGTVITAQYQMGQTWRMGAIPAESEFVSHGIFNWIRHPIYTGMSGILLGYLCLVPSPWLLMGFLQFVWLVILQSLLEERALIEQFGESYRRYMNSVGSFLPKLFTSTRKRESGSDPVNVSSQD